jgi:hypothetical protein
MSDGEIMELPTLEVRMEALCVAFDRIVAVTETFAAGQRDLIDKIEAITATTYAMPVVHPDLQRIVDEQQPMLMGVMPVLHPDLQWLVNKQQPMSMPAPQPSVLLELLPLPPPAAAVAPPPELPAPQQSVQPSAAAAPVLISISVELPPTPIASPSSTLFTVTSAGELGLDPCGDDGGNLVGVADGRQATCLHGVPLPAGSSSCHGCHWSDWRVNFVTTSSVDASPFFIGSAASVFFRPPFLIKEGKYYKSSLFPRNLEEILRTTSRFKATRKLLHATDQIVPTILACNQTRKSPS